MTVPSLPPQELVGENVRRYIAARMAHAHLEFRVALARMTAIIELPEVQLTIDEMPEDDILELAYVVERTRKILRFWRHAASPEPFGAYTRLQAARTHALETLTAPDDPTHPEGQRLERTAARSFYNHTTDEYLRWWIEHGEAMELQIAP